MSAQNSFTLQKQDKLLKCKYSSSNLIRAWEPPHSIDELERESSMFLAYLNMIFSTNPLLIQAGYFPPPPPPVKTTSTSTNLPPSPPGTPEPCSKTMLETLVELFKDGAIFAFLLHDIHPSSIDLSSFLEKESRISLRHSKASSTASTPSSTSASPQKLEFYTEEQQSSSSSSRNNSLRYFRNLSNIANILSKLSSAPFNLIPSCYAGTAQDVIDGNKHVILDLIYRCIKAHLLKDLSLDIHPELILISNGRASELLTDSEDQLLLKWVNYHLRNSSCDRTICNFGVDLNDGFIYGHLLQQIVPEHSKVLSLIQPFLAIELPAVQFLGENQHLQMRIKSSSLILRCINELLGTNFGISPLDMAEGSCRIHLFLLACLFSNFPNISLNTQPARSKPSPVVSGSDCTDCKKSKQALAQFEAKYKKHAVVKESQLHDQIEALEKAVINERENRTATQEFLGGRMEEMKFELMDNLSRTFHLLMAYKERRKEIFEDANEYTISAFNNEGKRIVFKIPAPQLRQKCSFEYSQVTKAVEKDSASRRAKMKTPVTWNTPQSSYDLPCPAPSKSDILTSLDTSFTEGPDSPISGSFRCMSAPPDVLLDKRGQSLDTITTDLADLTVTSASPLNISILGGRGSSIPVRKKETPARYFQKELEVMTTNVFSEVNDLSSTIHRLVQGLMEENMQQIQQIQLLAARVDEMSWLNGVMGKKVREFSEELIKKPKSKKK